jgi:hypothetical protein
LNIAHVFLENIPEKSLADVRAGSGSNCLDSYHTVKEISDCCQDDLPAD